MEDFKPHCSICESAGRFKPVTFGLVILAVVLLFGGLFLLAGCATQRDFEKEKIERRMAEREFSGLVLTLAEQLRQTLESQARTQAILKDLIESRQPRDERGRFKAGKWTQYADVRNPSLCAMIPGMESCKP